MRDGRYVGIDPGTSGAWAVVDVVGGVARGVAGCSWRKGRRKAGTVQRYAMASAGCDHEDRAWVEPGERPRTAAALLSAWAHQSAGRAQGVAMEGLFTSPKALHGVLTLAESAGWWLAECDAAELPEPARPLAQRWRRDLLGIGPRLDRKRCDELVSAWARTVPGPDGWQEWAGSPHAHDAVALAVWAATHGDEP